ncbi:MAG TPA: SIR2 family protein [Longimicrobium sp.]|jgi:hypothetical protein|uniref:SIR2 family protein n=1 Tax=Longimicrobium sp. TaxID=2029185 RepID=UPI002EDBB1B5
MAITLPEPLLDSVRRGKCIAFVGSGLSVAAGYPTWESLVRELVDEAMKTPFPRAEGLEKYIERRDWITLAEYARLKLGSEVNAILRKRLSHPVPALPAHRALAGTAFRGMITTNYDRLLETAITHGRGYAPLAFGPGALSSLADALFGPEFFLFKMHGDFSGSLVLSSRDYDRMIVRSPHVRAFLFSVFLNHTVLFVGYSLSDPDLYLALRELTLIFENHVPKHYALMAGAGTLEVEQMLAQMNIVAIPYDPADNHRAVTEALEQLRALAPYEPDIPEQVAAD